MTWEPRTISRIPTAQNHCTLFMRWRCHFCGPALAKFLELFPVCSVVMGSNPARSGGLKKISWAKKENLPWADPVNNGCQKMFRKVYARPFGIDLINYRLVKAKNVASASSTQYARCGRGSCFTFYWLFWFLVFFFFHRAESGKKKPLLNLIIVHTGTVYRSLGLTVHLQITGIIVETTCRSIRYQLSGNPEAVHLEWEKDA